MTNIHQVMSRVWRHPTLHFIQ